MKDISGFFFLISAYSADQNLHFKGSLIDSMQNVEERFQSFCTKYTEIELLASNLNFCGLFPGMVSSFISSDFEI